MLHPSFSVLLFFFFFSLNYENFQLECSRFGATSCSQIYFFLRKHRPDIVFLMETMMDEEQMLELCKNLGFGQNCYAVSRSGFNGGGLLLLWIQHWYLTGFHSSTGHISARYCYFTRSFFF